MFRIDVPSAAVALPAPAAAGSGGYFSNGNPATSVASTIVDQDWLNSVQEELVAIAISQGAALSKTTRNQCLTAIQAMVAGGASASAIQAQAPNYAAAGGTANAITAVFTPAIGAHILGAPLRVKIGTLNTGAVTFNPGPGVLALKAPDGSAIVSGELLPGAIHTFTYDGTQYLCASLTRSFAAAGAVGLVVTNDVTTPDSKIAVTCDSAICVDAIGRAAPVSAVNFTTAGTGAINLQVNGANGLDTGSFAGLASNWVHAFIIVKPDGTKAGLASLSATAPTMPAGYTFALRVGAMRLSGVPALLRTRQVGRDAAYISSAGLPAMASGNVGATPVAVPVAAFVPPTAVRVKALLQQGTSNTDASLMPNNTLLPYSTANVANAYGGWSDGTVSKQVALQYDMVLEGANIYWTSSGAGNRVAAVGWTDKVLAA